MNLAKAREAYQHDPQYHCLIDLLVKQVETLNMTPSEMREAVMFACIILEERRTHPLWVFSNQDWPQSSEAYRKFILGDWASKPIPKEPG